MLNKFNEQAQKVIVIAESIAFDFGHMSVGSEHLLLSLLKSSDIKLKKVLKEFNVNDDKIKDDIIRLFGTNEDQPFYMEYSDVVKDILEAAIKISKNRQEDKVSVNILCIAMLETKECVAVELLKKYNVDISDVIFNIKENSAMESKLDQIPSLVNLNKKVKNKDNKIIGRDFEIEKLCEILSKKEKSNAMIIGDAGVGKSALVEKLAMMINEKKVPKKLEKVLIYELSLAGIVAGTKYRGEFEEKLKKLIDNIKCVNNVVLFIDEIHNLIGAGGAEGAIDAANILKPYIARKDVTIIGATTTEEYYKYFEKEQAMNRRFSVIHLKENTKEETFDILLNIKGFYETYHDQIIEKDVLYYLVDLCDEHINNRTFPDKAIDILDLACVKGSVNNKKELTKHTIDKVVEEYCNIKLREKFNIEQIRTTLLEKVIGQEHVINNLLSKLENRKLNKKPKASYLFVGSTGVGKTTLVCALANCLDYKLVELDMFEYNDVTSINKILGSPSGYVGHNKPSLFLSALTKSPKSVVVFDNIEKAHKDVKNMILKIINKGYIEDNNKRKIYFNNSVIILTTNAVSKSNGIGFKKQEIESNIQSILSSSFLDSLDEVLYFKSISKNMVEKIISHKYPKLTKENIDLLTAKYSSKYGLKKILKSAEDLIFQESKV